jgi:hypothetical protein
MGRGAVIRAVTEVAAYDETVRDFWGQGLSPFSDRTIALLRAEQQAGRTPGVGLASQHLAGTRADGTERLADTFLQVHWLPSRCDAERCGHPAGRRSHEEVPVPIVGGLGIHLGQLWLTVRL